MSDWSDSLADLHAEGLDTFGVPATHTDALGTETACTVVLEQSTDAMTGDSPWPMRQWDLTASSALGIQPGDTLTLGADTWRVEGLLGDDGHLGRWAVRKDES